MFKFVVELLNLEKTKRLKYLWFYLGLLLDNYILSGSLNHLIIIHKKNNFVVTTKNVSNLQYLKRFDMNSKIKKQIQFINK